MACCRVLRTQPALLVLISRFSTTMRAKCDCEVVKLGSRDSDGLGDIRALGRKTNLGALNGEFKLTNQYSVVVSGHPFLPLQLQRVLYNCVSIGHKYYTRNIYGV